METSNRSEGSGQQQKYASHIKHTQIISLSAFFVFNAKYNISLFCFTIIIIQVEKTYKYKPLKKRHYFTLLWQV